MDMRLNLLTSHIVNNKRLRTCNAGSCFPASRLWRRPAAATAAAAAGACHGPRAVGRLGRAAAGTLVPAPQAAQLHQVLVHQLVPADCPQRDAAIGGDGGQLQLVPCGELPRHLPHRVGMLAAAWRGAEQRLATACRQGRGERSPAIVQLAACAAVLRLVSVAVWLAGGGHQDKAPPTLPLRGQP